LGQGAEVALLLLRGARKQQEVHVSLVGSRAVEGERPEKALSRLLEEGAQIQEAEAEPAPLLGEVGEKEARGPGLLPQRSQDLRSDLLLGEGALKGKDLGLHEEAEPPPEDLRLF
jgi:hypothetical protein